MLKAFPVVSLMQIALILTFNININFPFSGKISCSISHLFQVFENLQWDLENNTAFSVSSQSKCNFCGKLLTTITSIVQHLKIL